MELNEVTLSPSTTTMLPSNEPQTSAQSYKERNEWELQSNDSRERIDRNEPEGLQSLKPEGEGETDASEGSSQPYKSPVHGKETATTSF